LNATAAEIHTVKINSDLSEIKHQSLQMAEVNIGTIPPKKLSKFIDPFKIKPEEKESEEQNQI
jgi:hypothetical protein